MDKSNNLNLESLLAITMADIDIFLLKEEDQETDKNKLYSAEEIRHQLEETMIKMTNTLEKLGLNLSKPLY